MQRRNEHLWRYVERLEGRIAAQKLLLAELEKKFDRNQPREPAGSPEGGRWTSGAGGMTMTSNGRSARVLDPTGTAPWRERTDAFGADGRLEAQAVRMRDGTAIGSEFGVDGLDARHTVVLPGGRRFVFENDGATQTMRSPDGAVLARSTFGPSSVQSEPTIQLASTALLRDAQRASLALYNSPGRGGAAIFGFPATDSPDDAIPHVRELTRAEMARACPGYPTVQMLTTTAAASIRREDYRNEAAYGTAVHTAVARSINGPPPHRPGNPIDPNFRAEFSLTKDDRAGSWGRAGTIRIDVYERPPSGPICVYDIKTGRNGLSAEHMEEIFGRVRRLYPYERRPVNIATVRP